MKEKNDIKQEKIREHNRKKIIEALSSNQKLTRRQIAKKINVSLPTVITITNELMGEGIVFESGVAGSTGGRKPGYLSFIKNSRYSFGVDFFMDHVRIILTNLKSEILEDEYLNTSQPNDCEANIKKSMEEVSSCIKKIISSRKLPEDNILGAGFSLPGTVNDEDMILEYSPNLNIMDIDFKDYRDMFGFPIFIENDANLSAFAETKLGIAKKKQDLAYIFVTKGIGVGIIIGGRIYRGHNKRAGEFGHMIIDLQGRECLICGKRGCWNSYVSRDALISDFNDTSGARIKSVNEFMELLRSGNNAAGEVLDRYIYFLSVGLFNLITAIDPYYIVIGGEIAQLDKFLLEPLIEKILFKNFFLNREDIKILFSKLKEDAPVLGASLLPLKDFLYIDEDII